MSSFFDDAQTRISVFTNTANQEAAINLAEAAFQRVKEYIDYIDLHALKAEASKVAEVKKMLTVLPKAGLQSDPLRFVSDLHTLGHGIGRLRIQLRGGRLVGDNPYFPDHYGML